MNTPFIGLLTLIVWLPLPYGSNHAWAWALMEVWIFSIALVWLWQYLRGRQKLTPVFFKAIPILIIWVIWLIYITFQCTPLPYAWIQWLSPQAAEAYAFFNPTYTTLSVDSHSTTVGLLKSLSYVLLFTLTLLLVNTRSRLRWVAYALVLSGFFQAAYGSVMMLSGVEYGFFHEKVYGRGVATGTFINRNHLAGYLEMCLAVGIGLLIAQLGDGTRSDTWQQRLVAVLSWIMSPKMRLRLILVFMVIALVLTHSRMGNTAFFASLIIAGILALILSRHANRATVILLVSLIVIDIFMVGSWFGLEKVKQRIEQTSLATETRDEVDIDSLPYWQDYFWTGSGLGSFYTTFPGYQRAEVTGFYDHAHNDYLEFAAETGLIGVLLLGITMLLTSSVVLIALYRRRRSLNRGMAFAATMVITALFIHSTVDFNLQIPANAATFMLILGLGWVARYLPTIQGQKKNLSHNPVNLRPSRLVKSVSLSLIAGLIYLVYVAGSWGVADSIAKQARAKMAQWARQDVVAMNNWEAATERLFTSALQLEPSNPKLLKNRGIFYFRRATLNINTAQKAALHQQSLDYLLKSAKQRPTDAYTWADIILTKHHLRQYDALFLMALEKTVLLAPWVPSIQYKIADVGLAAWYRLPRQAQHIVIATVERGMKIQAGIITALIKRRKREWVVCAYLQQTVISEFCQQKTTEQLNNIR